MRITSASHDKSVSVLIPGEGPILHKDCTGTRRWELLDWFASVEARFWQLVKTRFKKRQPKSIFLVTGQTLTSNYKITHQQTTSTGCELRIEYDPGHPVAFKSHVLSHNLHLGYGYRSVSGLQGFEITKTDYDIKAMSSVFLEVVESQTVPPNRIKTAGDYLR